MSTYHGSAVVLGHKAILILGESGVGKTSLCRDLVQFARARNGYYARWLADDRVYMNAVNGRIILSAPEALRGKAELYGFGIVDVETCPEAQLGLVVELVRTETAERMPEQNYFSFSEIDVPKLTLTYSPSSLGCIMHFIDHVIYFSCIAP